MSYRKLVSGTIHLYRLHGTDAPCGPLIDIKRLSQSYVEDPNRQCIGANMTRSALGPSLLLLLKNLPCNRPTASLLWDVACIISCLGCGSWKGDAEEPRLKDALDENLFEVS